MRGIPLGKVTTYGGIAAIVGCGARQVGYALAALPEDTDVPWHRVLNHQGRVSLSAEHAAMQQRLLEQEGVMFDTSGRVDLQKFALPD